MAVDHLEEVVRRDDVLAVGARHVQPQGLAAHGNDGRVGLGLPHRFGRDLRLEMHGDLGMLLHLREEVVQVALVVGAEDAAHLHAPAEARPFLVEVDGVPALRRGQRGVDARRARTHHHDLLALRRLRERFMVEFLAQTRVHAAVVERLALAHHVVQAAAAHDAQAHVASAVLHHLAGQRRVGDAVAQPGDHVQLAVLEVLLHHARIGVAIPLRHRFLRHGLDLLRDERPVAVLDGLRGERLAGLVPAHGKVVQVAARFLQHGGDAQRILHGQARTRGALDEVDGRPAHDDGELRSHDLAHAADHLERQLHAVLQAAAVLVGAVVGGQRHEARQDAAHARHDLDGVEAGFLAHARRVEVLLLERLDLLERHGAEAAHELEDGDVGRAVGAFRRFGVGLPVVHVVRLRADEAAVLVHRLDHVALQVGDAAFVVAAGKLVDVIGIDVVALPRADGLDDEGRLPFGALLQVVRQTLRGTVVLGHVSRARRHGRGDHAVLQGDAVHLQRRSQDGVLRAHAFESSLRSCRCRCSVRAPTGVAAPTSRSWVTGAMPTSRCASKLSATPPA